ncbi:MAG: hypothetical protein JO316_01270 [Abitibacteriaceae bacterium]|nr:hypothetical protein [Abditibacteriaceae bacterium]MBV9863960.1 hypothetical protein [Abditibacteriaceae bacterium]
MASSIRSFTVAGWGSAGLAAPDDMQESKLATWLERYQYQAEPCLTLGTPGTGFSVRVYRAELGGGYDHDFALALGLTQNVEIILTKDAGSLTDLLQRLAPIVDTSRAG